MTQYEGNYDTVWLLGWVPMRFVKGQYGLCGGAAGLSAPVAEAATVRWMVICASLTSGQETPRIAPASQLASLGGYASPFRERDAPAPNGGRG